MSLQTGDVIPAFNLPSTGGDPVQSAAYAGRLLVLFFYPRDDTSGCTKEAIAFSGLKPQFDALGAAVFGVSKDPIAAHHKFIAKHDLTVPLLSDADDDLCERCGVWVEKSMYGRKFMGIERTTLLVGTDGRVVKIWNKVKVPGHAEAVLDAVQAIAG